MSAYCDIASLLPVSLEQRLNKLPSTSANSVTEIHIKASLPLFVMVNRKAVVLGEEKLTLREINDSFMSVCGYNAFNRDEQVRMGFVALAGGHRVGLCGSYSSQRFHATGLVIRIAREYHGFSELLFKYVNVADSSVLVCGGVGSGKTTLLRDCIRTLSSPPLYRRVSVLDERGELSGSMNGVAQFSFGLTADFICCCERSTGAENAVRALSPQILVCDELYTRQDRHMLKTASVKGVKLFASVHTGADPLKDAAEWLGCSGSGDIFQYAVMLDSSSLSTGQYKVQRLC